MILYEEYILCIDKYIAKTDAYQQFYYKLKCCSYKK